jgi:hypothetical protein
MTDYIFREFEERRGKHNPIPDHLGSMLNKLQMSTLLELEALGWKLWFVRRPLFQPVMPVVCDPFNSFTAVLEEDGSYNADHGINFRPQ